MRWILRPIFRLVKKGLLSQNFQTKGYSTYFIQTKYTSLFSEMNLSFFNFTVTPFNQLVPKLSVQLSKFFERKAKNSCLEKLLAADFLIRWKK